MDKPEQLNAIVGAAIKAMAEAGVSPERLGSFAAEFRTHVKTVMGCEPRSAEPDLLSVVKTAVREAMSEAKAVVSLVPEATASSEPAAGVRRIYVTIGGKRTSVSIPESVYGSLERQAGGSGRAVKRQIEAVAQEAPANLENRSGWITERLRAMALADIPDTAFSQRH